jgi:general stress protein 26
MATQHNSADARHEDLEGRSAADKIREIAQNSPICFFVTNKRTPGSSGARPMTVQKVDEQGNLWFISSIDTHKDQELHLDPVVSLYFQSVERSEYLEVHGRASVSQNKHEIEDLWQPQFDAWFDMGKNDPRVSVIKVMPEEGHYWDSESGLANGMRTMLSNFFLQPAQPSSAEGKLRP